MALTCSLINDHVSSSCDRQNSLVLINRQWTMTHEWNEFLFKSSIKPLFHFSSVTICVIHCPNQIKLEAITAISSMKIFVCVQTVATMSTTTMFPWNMDEMFVVVRVSSQFWVHFLHSCSNCAKVSIGCAILPTKKWLFYHISDLSCRNPEVVFMSLWVELGPSHS